MIVHGLQNGRKSNVQHAHILPTERVPKNFHFLPFRIGHNLTGDIHLIGVVENIQTQVVGNVSEIDLLKGGKPELHNVLNLFSSDARNSSHDLIDIHLAIVKILGEIGLVKYFFNIFHGVGSGIRR